MSCREQRLVWSVNFALQAVLATLWRQHDLIYTRRLTMTHVSTTSHCSKREVTMVSGSLATLDTRVPITTATTCDESLILFLHGYSVNNTTVILLTGKRVHTHDAFRKKRLRNLIWVIPKQSEVIHQRLRWRWKPVPSIFNGFYVALSLAQGGVPFNDSY